MSKLKVEGWTSWKYWKNPEIIQIMPNEVLTRDERDVLAVYRLKKLREQIKKIKGTKYAKS